MKIFLMRHGKPKLPHFSKLRAAEMQEWIAAYNAAGICESHSPDRNTLLLAQKCQFVVCSDRPRSTTSAQRLMLKEIHHISEDFREAGLPYCSIPLFRLSPNVWAVLFRLMWFLGFSKNSESIHAFKSRAQQCSSQLEDAAQGHSDVLFVGHAFMNRFIAKYLGANGWVETTVGHSQYWSTAVFEKYQNG